MDSCKRAFDIALASILLVLFGPPMLIIAAAVRLSSKGPALYWSERIGRDNHIFRMPKFRTMRQGTPVVATHLLQHAENFVTPIGKWLRQLSLDELPQLYSVLKGDMSFVGPRPALFNQYDLIELRIRRGIHRQVPGITGWAQINGRDELPIVVKVQYDEQYLKNMSLRFDLRILAMTLIRVIRSQGVSH